MLSKPFLEAPLYTSPCNVVLAGLFHPALVKAFSCLVCSLFLIHYLQGSILCWGGGWGEGGGDRGYWEAVPFIKAFLKIINFV